MFDRTKITDSEFHDFSAHFPSQVSKEIVDYARDVAFKWSRYIFTRKVGNKQYGYCTHCGKEYETGGGLKHNDKVLCLKCGSECKVKASGRGRKKMIDEAYFVWYEKSLINPQAIVARGIYLVRDYSDDYWRVETQFKDIAMYIFEPGNAQMIKRYASYTSRSFYDKFYGPGRVGPWEKCHSVYTLVNNNTMSNHISNISFSCSHESIKEAVLNTPFSWSGWELYRKDYVDMVKFFDLFAKYPCVEYLTKLGFYDLVDGKLSGYNTSGVINWRGKTLFKVLKINKQELKAIKSQSIHVTFAFLRALRILKTDDSSFTPAENVKIAETFKGYHIDELRKSLKYGNYRKITHYLLKQSQKHHKNITSESGALTTWRDYIDDCINLEMDLKKESVLFPGDLYTAHQNTIRQLKMKADESLNKQIASRLKSLEKFRFESDGLFIRPAANSLELFDEGKILDHCVYRNYAEKYAKGETNIFFIRREEEPDKPFYTVEIIGNFIIQARGYKNFDPTEEVQWFIEAFTKAKLNRKRTRNKTKIAVPA
ncbi:MAG: PcfJ domain-containing protein [Desulfitobacteriaceae bacterium]